jgi:hypothetical protein
MATKQPTEANISSTLKSLKYGDTVLTDKPFYSIEGKHFYFYIPKVKGSTDTRRTFLAELSKSLNDKGLVNFYDDKNSSLSSIGKISFAESKIAVICKYFESSSSTKEGSIKLKPSNIVPSIVGQWITPEDMAKNVQTYIKKIKAPKPLADQINMLLKESLTTERSFFIDGEVDEILVPAEFFEVLTAIKMAILLRNNETELKSVLKFLDKSKKIDYKFSASSPLKINIPKKSNYPLTDYEISFKPDNYKETVKVSVKSKVKSDNTNTLKLNQVFDSVTDVGHWYRSLNSSMKKQQYAQAQVAYAHLRYSTQSKLGKKGKAATKRSAAIPPTPAEKYAGKVKVGFPIDAVGHILQIPYLKLDSVIMARSKFMDKNIKRTPNANEVKMFAIVCRRIPRIISKTSTDTNLDAIFTKKSEAKLLATVINLVSTNNVVNKIPAEPNLINLGKYCEKILEWASKKSSPTKLYNFYEMFHKKVLEERAICYAISDSKRHKSANGVKTEVIFKYETLINWDTMWIGMRQKAGDSLGLDL